MVKKVAPVSTSAKETISVLISQPKPESEKSPYFELEKKFTNVKLYFHPFIKIESLTPKEFRQQKINVLEQTAVIFTSRNAIDQYFKLTEEMRLAINQNTKYFCISESVALYLQKFILYRKRKVFFGADGTNKGYRTVSNDIKEIFKKNKFQIICLFTRSGTNSLLENFPKFKQGDKIIGAFGANTIEYTEQMGLRVDIKAPVPKYSSMVSALEHYLNEASL